MPLQQGARARTYGIVQPLGAGGMGEVFNAEDYCPRAGRQLTRTVMGAGAPLTTGT